MSDENIHLRESGIRKAAILVACIDPAVADAMLAQLPAEQAQQVREAATLMGEIDHGERQRIIDEFLRVAPMVPAQSPPGIELDAPRVDARVFHRRQPRVPLDSRDAPSAADAGRHASPAASSNSDASADSADECSPFSFLSEAADEKLANLLASERPQTVALVLSHLPSRQAGCVLAHFPPNLQVEVIRRLVDLEDADPAVLHEVERALETRLSKQFAVQRRRVAGLEAISEILNACDDRTSGILLENLAACDRPLAEKLGLQSMTFEDLASLGDSLLAAVFRAADPSLTQTALIAAPPSLVQRILATMPPRDARHLRKQLAHPGPLRLSDMEDARRQIAAMAQRMLKNTKKPASAFAA